MELKAMLITIMAFYEIFSGSDDVELSKLIKVIFVSKTCHRNPNFNAFTNLMIHICWSVDDVCVKVSSSGMKPIFKVNWPIEAI